MMRWMVRTSLIAVATSFLATVGASAQNNSSDMFGWAQHWAADHQHHGGMGPPGGAHQHRASEGGDWDSDEN